VGALPTIAVVMPTHNRAGSLEAALAPLLADPNLTELVVVDDGSIDSTPAVLDRLCQASPQLRPIRQQQAGAAAATLRGIEAANSEVILFLDDDEVASRRLVTGHAIHHASATNLVVLGYTPVPTALLSGKLRIPARLYSEVYERQCRDWEQSPETILRHFWGGHFSMRRIDCLNVGFRGSVKLAYHYDYEFGLRCAAVGLQGRFDRSLCAEHFYERSISGFLRDARSAGTASVRVSELRPAREMAQPRDIDPPRFDRLSRLLEWIAKSRVMTMVVSWILIGVGLLTSVSGLTTVEVRLAFVLRRLHWHRGRTLERRRQRDTSVRI
jgi:GT2 family glycosyltransferase